MKRLFLIIVPLYISIKAFAGIDELKCDAMIGYRPGGETLLSASNSFQTEIEILLNSCEVQKKYPTKKNTYYYMKSFSNIDAKKTLVYKMVYFSDEKTPMESTCTLTETTSFDPKNAGQYNDDLTVVVSQVCTEPVVAR